MSNKYIEVLNINNYKTELMDASALGGSSLPEVTSEDNGDVWRIWQVRRQLIV